MITLKITELQGVQVYLKSNLVGDSIINPLLQEQALPLNSNLNNK